MLTDGQHSDIGAAINEETIALVLLSRLGEIFGVVIPCRWSRMAQNSPSAKFMLCTHSGRHAEDQSG